MRLRHILSLRVMTNINCNIRRNVSTCAALCGKPETMAKQVRTMSAPGICFSWDYAISPDELRSRAAKAIEEFRAAYDKVGALKPEEATFENVLHVLAELDRRVENEELFLEFPKYVSPCKELREASTSADQMMQKFNVETSMRLDIFQKLQALEKQDTSVLPAEMQRFLERLIKLGKRNGLHLAKEVQEQVKELLNTINDHCIQYIKVCNEENSTVEFTEQELEGVPEDLIKSFDMVESGMRKVTLKPPHYMPIMKKAKNPETRRRMGFAYGTCCSENTATIEKVIKLRHEKAQLLGYPDHVSFVTELLMAKTKDNVHKFLTELAEKLQPSWQKEKQQLLRYKEKECLEMGIPFDGKINAWDMRYYTNMVKEQEYSVDQEKLREYFPLDAVSRGLLGIYQELLGLTFTEVTPVKLWHPEATLYKVTDTSTQELMGYFAMDLFPREGKYSHFCNISLQPGCKMADGSRQVPFVAIVCNFTKPTADKPSLLTHDEVETFFHEFGHTMHHICSKVDLAMFEGTKVERDFLECPSQMLENWVWEAKPLERMSSHHVTGEHLPSELLKPLVASRLAGVASFTLRQLCLGLCDHAMHTRAEVDTQELFREVQESLMGYPPQEGTNMATNFSHLANGYSGRYYSYMWSEVFSMDLFNTRFKKEGLLNKETGMDYRRKVLEPAGTQDASVILRNFLGRDPSSEAFLVSKGLAV